jgi:hypothetical protein
MFQLVHLVLDLLQLTECRKRGFVYRRPGLKVNVLCKQSQANVAGANDVTSIWSFVSRDESENGRLTCAVSTYKANMLARIDLE